MLAFRVPLPFSCGSGHSQATDRTARTSAASSTGIDLPPGSGPLRISLLLHDALQRMLMFAGKVHDLRHFGFGDLVGEHTALADPVVVHVQHNASRSFAVLVKKPLQH